MSEPQKPVIPGVNLPCAEEEGSQLYRWANQTYGTGSFVWIINKLGPLGIFLRPTPKAHGLIVSIERADYRPLELCDQEREWRDTLTLHGYRTAVCAGFLEARREIMCYLQQPDTILKTPATPLSDP